MFSYGCFLFLGMTYPNPCQPGFYCPIGSANQHPCPSGSYGNQSKLAESSECTLCDPGAYCMGSGTVWQMIIVPRESILILSGLICSWYLFICPGNISPTGPCGAGFLCLGGASVPSPNDNETGMPCPSGSYCPAGSFAPIPCPKGTFRWDMKRVKQQLSFYLLLLQLKWKSFL